MKNMVDNLELNKTNIFSEMSLLVPTHSVHIDSLINIEENNKQLVFLENKQNKHISFYKVI